MTLFSFEHVRKQKFFGSFSKKNRLLCFCRREDALAFKFSSGYLLDMQAHLTRWGNSLGLRIPKDLAGRFRLTEGARVELEAQGDHIVISMPARYELSEMLAGLTPAAMSDAFDWGDDQGREAVD